MGVLKGQNLRLKLAGKYVAFATSCTVHVSATLEDSSHKDVTGDWQSQEITGMAWDISTDALFAVADTTADAAAKNGVDALDLVLAKNKVWVEFIIDVAGTNNRQPQTNAKTYSGYAWVNDISISAPNRQNATYSLQATGDGSLQLNNSSNSNI